MSTDELSFRTKLIAMAAPANPSAEQIQELWVDWLAYFHVMQIPIQKQIEEFDSIIRMRASLGEISLLAPKLFLNFSTSMPATEYQQLAARTLVNAPVEPFTNEESMLLWNAIGLAGEAGEVADAIKKGVCHRHGIDKDALKKELGDVLWYVAGIATELGLDLGEIMKANIEKLKARYPEGFSVEESHHND